MITLYQYPGFAGLPSASPFCIKVETYLRMTGLAFEVRHLTDPRRAPLGKLPYIRDGDRIVADSTLILDHLRKTHGDALDDGLSARDRAAALGLQRLMEEHLYWYAVHLRWIDERNWPEARRDYFGTVPLPMRLIIPSVARRVVRSELHGHGFGRHGEADRNALALADITALSDWLGDQDFMLGAAPRSLDATAYPFLAMLIVPPLHNPLRAEIDKHANLARYCERMRARYYAD